MRRMFSRTNRGRVRMINILGGIGGSDRHPYRREVKGAEMLLKQTEMGGNTEARPKVD